MRYVLEGEVWSCVRGMGFLPHLLLLMNLFSADLQSFSNAPDSDESVYVKKTTGDWLWLVMKCIFL